MHLPIFLDCTLRDGGCYNSWDFDHSLVQDYIFAVKDAGVDVVELGFRTLNKHGFKGACAYTNDSFIQSLVIPNGLTLGVMINASEIIEEDGLSIANLNQLFPTNSAKSNISIIRIASHTHEFIEALKAVKILKEKGFKVGFNLMQVSECDPNELILLAKEASKYRIDVLYFADSLGNMNTKDVLTVIELFRSHWKGKLGIHAHNNMGMALSNSLFALDNGITWVDSTVTGMGRGAGNANTELLAIEIAELRNTKVNINPLISLISREFKPLKDKYGWGTNPFYYLSGKNSVHPTYVQEMMSDSRYTDEDIIAVIENLGSKDGKKYSRSSLLEARNYYSKASQGTWSPLELFEEREVILIGSGPGISSHKRAIEDYIKNSKPLVLALNAQSSIDNDLIDVRIACHPLRLKADYEKLLNFSKPLITPASSLPKEVLDLMSSIEIFDYGLSVETNQLKYEQTSCVLSNSIVISYALAVASSGKASRLLLAGFDGYSADDPLRIENDMIFKAHQDMDSAVKILSVTPTLYNINTTSIYAL